jgi:hypothetical protein
MNSPTLPEPYESYSRSIPKARAWLEGRIDHYSQRPEPQAAPQPEVYPEEIEEDNAPAPLPVPTEPVYIGEVEPQLFHVFGIQPEGNEEEREEILKPNLVIPPGEDWRREYRQWAATQTDEEQEAILTDIMTTGDHGAEGVGFHRLTN